MNNYNKHQQEEKIKRNVLNWMFIILVALFFLNLCSCSSSQSLAHVHKKPVGYQKMHSNSCPAYKIKQYTKYIR